MSLTNLFELDINSEQNVYNHFGKSKKEIDKYVQIIGEWLKTQTHLPEIMEEAKVRNFLILTKFNIEKTKEKIDAYYSMRVTMADWFRDNNPNCPRMVAANKECVWAVLPQQLNGLYRVHFFKLRTPGKLQIYETAIQFFNIVELRLKDDYLTGDIVLVDSSNTSLRDYLKVTPLFLIKGFKVYQKIFSSRLKVLHCMNASPAISIILKILKTILKPKMFQRITASKDESFLKELLSEDQIPSDYGGKGPSIQELNTLLVQKFSEQEELFQKLERFVAN